MSATTARAVVIGAGFGGLAAAIALARRGLRVAVLEAASEPGGKAGTATVDGVTFDTGPSLLTMPHVLDSVLQLAGTRLEEVVTLRRASPAFRYRFDDGVVLDVHHALEDTLASVRDTLGVGPADELRAFLGYARRIWEAAAPPFVYGDAPSVSGLASMGWQALSALGRVDALADMWPAITRRVTSPHLQTLLARYATYNGSDVRAAPATLNCIAWVELGLGGYGVEGGMQRLVEVLVDAARGLGVRFVMNARVTGIDLDGGRATGVRVAGGPTLAADLVVSNTAARHLFEDLLPGRPRRPHPGRQAPSMSGWTAVFKARRRLGEASPAAHEVLMPSRYLDEFRDLFDAGTVPRDPTIYACDQTAAHGIAGWAGARPLFAMVNAPPVGSGTAAAAEVGPALQANVRARLEAAGLLSPCDEIAWQRTPRDLAQRFPGSSGSLYGAASNGRMAAFRRPANRVPRTSNVYLASGSAHPGGGVPLVVLSGLAAARAALADLGVRGSLSQVDTRAYNDCGHG